MDNKDSSVSFLFDVDDDWENDECQIEPWQISPDLYNLLTEEEISSLSYEQIWWMLALEDEEFQAYLNSPVYYEQIVKDISSPEKKKIETPGMVRSIPDYKDLLVPMLQALKELGGNAHREELYKTIIHNEKFSQEQLAVTTTDPGKNEIGQIVMNLHYASACLRENDLLTYPRPNYRSLTEKARTTPTFDTDVLVSNFESTRQQRLLQHKKQEAARMNGPVKIPNKYELLQPVLDAMHALDGIGETEAIIKQVIVSQNLLAPSLLKGEFWENSKRLKSLISNINSARLLLGKTGLLRRRSNREWALTKKGETIDTIDLHHIRSAEAGYKVKKSEERAANKSILFLRTLEELLYDRRASRPEGHYTSNLFAAGPARIAQKVGEEALEVIIAALHESRERQISEVADLLVHTLILLVELNIPLEEVLAELQRRHEARAS